MTDDDVHTLIGAYALDAVDDDERARVRRHLGDCESCRAEAAELTATAARLADAAVDEPPPGLRARVLAEVDRTRQDPPASVPVPKRTAEPRRWRLFTLAAAVAAVVAAGAATATYVVQQHRVDDARADVQAAQRRADRIAAIVSAPDAVAASVPAADGGSILVVRSASLDAAYVTRVGMPELSADETYQLWLARDGVMRSAGLMPGLTAVVDGISGAEGVALSTEPAGGSATPTNPVGIIPFD